MNSSKPPFLGSSSDPHPSPIQIALIHKSVGSYHLRNPSTKVPYNPPSIGQIQSKNLSPQKSPSPFKRRHLSLSLDQGNPQAARYPGHSDYYEMNDDDDYFNVADQGTALQIPSAKMTSQTFASIRTPRAHTGFSFFTPDKFSRRSRFPSIGGALRRPNSHLGKRESKARSARKPLIFTPKRVENSIYSSIFSLSAQKEEQKKAPRKKDSFVSISSHNSKYSNRDYVPTPNLNISFIRGQSIENCTSDSQEQEDLKSNDPSLDSKITGKQKSRVKFKPENVIQCYSLSTKAGTTIDKQKKDNQDSFTVAPKLLGLRYMHFFGVYDGHGQNGHFVSKYVKEKLLANIKHEMKEMIKSFQRQKFDNQAIVESLRKSHILTNIQLCNERSIDTRFSGTTSCSVFLLGSTLYCCNVGDSRVIVGQFRDGKWVGQPISRDHKPDHTHEKQRIEKSGGVVQQFYEKAAKVYLGPMRVYSKKGEWPGLAMSRSIGDQVAKKLGVVAEPQISEVKLTSNDKFILIASDGVWEFLSDNEVAEVIGPQYLKGDAEAGVRSVMRTALNAWKKKQTMIDDITCVLLHLNVEPSKQSLSGAS